MSTRFFTLSIAFGIAAMSTASYAAGAVKADFNGDGFADVATSIPFKDVTGAADAGAVQILYSDGQGGGLTAANGQILDRTNCPFSNAGDRFGAAMAAGDFNGDTFADLAIGIPFADVPGVNGTVQDAGAVLIVYGTETGLVCNKGTAQLRFQDFVNIEDQSEAGDRFGSALVAANFDGDARVVTDSSGTVLNVIPYDDLAIGVPGEDINGTDAGMINVLYGSSTGVTVSGDQVFSQAAGHGLAGAAENGDQFGSALAAGNFNRDFNAVGGQPVAIDELAVGAPGENLGGKSDVGAVNIVYGSISGLTPAGGQFWSQNSPGILGAAEDGDRFGHALAAGDFDGDGTDDLAVSAPLEDIGSVTDAGAVNVIVGKAGTGLDDDRNQLWHEDAVDVLGNVIGTAEGNDQFGFALVAAGFNETGLDDLAIGVPGQAVNGKDNAGAVHVFYGSRPGGVFSNGGFRTDLQQHWHLDQSDFDGNVVAGTSQPNDSYGVALGAGDINGDNAADLVIGISQKDVPLGAALIPDAGAISVLYGTPLDGFGKSSEITAKGNQFLHQGATDASGNVVDGIPRAFDRFGSGLSHGAFVTGEGSRGEGDAQDQALERKRIDDDDDPEPVPDDDPPPPTTPPVRGTLVRISSAELDQTLGDVLQGTKLVVDTTGRSPPLIIGYHTECTEGPGPIGQVCVQVPEITHSYIDFGGIAESFGAVDVPFDNITMIYRDTKGPGGIMVDINYVRTTVNAGTLFAHFSPELSHRATASVWLNLQSNNPTLPCEHTLLVCPDIELTDMRVLTRLTGIGPVWDDPTQLGFDQAIAHFYFNRNLNNIPDWLLTELVDVDQIIRNNVERNIARALSSTAGRTALNKALTGLVAQKVNPNPMPVTGGGIKQFYGAWYETGGTLVVDYEPQPKVGSGPVL